MERVSSIKLNRQEFLEVTTLNNACPHKLFKSDRNIKYVPFPKYYLNLYDIEQLRVILGGMNDNLDVTPILFVEDTTPIETYEQYEAFMEEMETLTALRKADINLKYFYDVNQMGMLLELIRDNLDVNIIRNKYMSTSTMYSKEKFNGRYKTGVYEGVETWCNFLLDDNALKQASEDYKQGKPLYYLNALMTTGVDSLAELRELNNILLEWKFTLNQIKVIFELYPRMQGCNVKDIVLSCRELDNKLSANITYRLLLNHINNTNINLDADLSNLDEFDALLYLYNTNNNDEVGDNYRNQRGGEPPTQKITSNDCDEVWHDVEYYSPTAPIRQIQHMDIHQAIISTIDYNKYSIFDLARIIYEAGRTYYIK